MTAEPAYIAVVFCTVGVSMYYTWWLLKWLMAKDEGTPAMRAVAAAIREGADSFLNVQYRTVAMFAGGFAVVIFFIYIFLRGGASDVPLSNLTMALVTMTAFLLGAACSGISGWFGMYVSVRSNVRAAAAAVVSADDAIKTCLRGGAFSGMLIVSLSLFGVTTMYTFVRSLLFFMVLSALRSVLLSHGFQ